MFELPQLQSGQERQVGQVADWIELSCLCEQVGVLSRARVADSLRDAGQFGGEPDAALPSDARDLLGQLTFSAQDVATRFAELSWAELRKRQLCVGERAYPILIRGDLAERRKDRWHATPAFTMLLIADLGRSYRDVKATIPREKGASRLFEKVVEASCRGLFNGRTERFGWPRERHWPSSIDDRIRTLGERLGLAVENLDGKTQASDKDKGLDVASRFSIGDDAPGTVTFLIQCASGANWRDKRGEPSYEEWKDLLQWDSRLVRAVALPWRLRERSEYKRTFRHFDAVVLDRLRLAAGNPDSVLDNGTRAAIRRWCTQRLKEIPKSGP